MRRLQTFCFGVLFCSACLGAAERTQGPSLMNFASTASRFWVRLAVDGASTRLQEPECQRIFEDFRDRSGNLLSANLRAHGVTVREYVASWIWFVDGSAERGCAPSYHRNAFTQPGSRVIYICGQRLVNAAAAIGSAERDISIIHEILHTLGLGENPPTSMQITKQVALRCGR